MEKVTRLSWVEPPPGGPKYDHKGIAAMLRARPGRWAKVFTNVNNSYATFIKNGTLKAYRPAGSFETTCRAVDQVNGNCDVYVRYIGEEGQYKEEEVRDES